MNKRILCVLLIATVLTAAAIASAEHAPRAVKPARPAAMAVKAVLDTVFFDSFETEKGWTVTDMAVQPPYWHIDSYNAYSGSSWWCGTSVDTLGWATPPGYGDGWAQFLVTPEFDLTGVTADSILFTMMHAYNLEPVSGGLDWDCINAWVDTTGDSTWGIENWQMLYPDELRYPGTAYTLNTPYSWTYTGLVPDGMPIHGWSGNSGGWTQIGFDLTEYIGKRVRICFIGCSDARTSDQTDGTFHGMWRMDNFSVDTLSAGGTPGNVFFDDCESGTGGWRATGKTPVYFWDKTTRRANSPTQSWWNGTPATGLYRWGQSDALVSPIIDLREVRTTDPCLLDFKLWADVPDDGTDSNEVNDWWKIQVSPDSGRNWLDLVEYIFIDSSKTWINQSDFGELSLADFIGQTVMIRIGFGSDGDNLVGEGLYIDDFSVQGKTRDPLPGPSTVLLVDNDGNAQDIAAESWTKYVEASLVNIGCRYSVAAIGGNRPITPGYLEQFAAVIWNMGPNTALADSDRANLMSYLDHGGKLWFLGQTFLGFGTVDTTVHPNLWSDYLHLAPSNGWFGSACYTFAGVALDSIGNGLADTLLYARLNGNGDWTDQWRGYSLTPDTPSYAVQGFAQNGDGTYNGLRYYDPGTGYKFLHTSFPFEAIATPAMRDSLTARIIVWALNAPPEYTPPAVPIGMTVIQSSDTAKCLWNSNDEPDLAGYHVYRALQVGYPVWTVIGTTAPSDTAFDDTTVVPDFRYFYAVTAFDNAVPANESQKSEWQTIWIDPFKLGVQTGAPSGAAGVFRVFQNDPNPFRSATTIRYNLPEPSFVEIAVYSITGQKVATLSGRREGAGEHYVRWDGTGDTGLRLANGVYCYRVETRADRSGAQRSSVKRLTLIK